MKSRCLTIKAMSNKKFRKTEEMILRVFFSWKGGVMGMSRVARRVGIARSTLYRHHKAAGEIKDDLAEYVFDMYRRRMRRIMRKRDVRLRKTYMEMLVFIVQNRGLIGYLVKVGDKGLFERMVRELKPKVYSTQRLSDMYDDVYNIYVSEVVEILYWWGRREFNEVEISEVLGNIIYLSETIKQRLGVLV